MLQISSITKKQVAEAFRAVERVRFSVMQDLPTAEAISDWTHAYDQFRAAEEQWLNGQSTS
jgi:hypothetical protein